MILSETATNNVNWKFMWAPFDETTYLDVLDRIEPHDIILYIIVNFKCILILLLIEWVVPRFEVF